MHGGSQTGLCRVRAPPPPGTLWIFVGVDSPLHPGAILTLQGRPSQRLSPCCWAAAVSIHLWRQEKEKGSCRYLRIFLRSCKSYLKHLQNVAQVLARNSYLRRESKFCHGHLNEVPTSFVWLKVQFVVILEHSWLGIHWRQSKQWRFSLCFFPSLHWLHSHRLQQQVLLRPPNVFQICNRIGPCAGGIFHQKIHTQEDGNLHAHMVSFNNSYSLLYRIELYIDSLCI